MTKFPSSIEKFLSTGKKIYLFINLLPCILFDFLWYKKYTNKHQKEYTGLISLLKLYTLNFQLFNNLWKIKKWNDRKTEFHLYENVHSAFKQMVNVLPKTRISKWICHWHYNFEMSFDNNDKPTFTKKNPGRTAIHITYAILHKPRLRTFFWTAFYPPHGRIQNFFGRVGSLLSLVSPWDAIVVGNEVKISKISLSRLAKIAFIRFFLYISCVPSLPSILLSS